MASFQQNFGDLPDLRPFLSTLEPSPTPGDTGAELSAVESIGLHVFQVYISRHSNDGKV